MIRRWWRRRLERRRAEFRWKRLQLDLILIGLQCRLDRLGGIDAVRVAAEIEEGREHMAELDRRLAKLDRRLA